MKQYWDVVVLFLLIYTALFVPYKVCFIEESTDGQFIFDLMVDFLFMTDIVINFFTIIEVKGKLEVNRCRIAIHYLKGWFFLDFFTSIPF